MESTAQEDQKIIEVTIRENSEELMAQNSPEDTNSVRSVAGARLVFLFCFKDRPWLYFEAELFTRNIQALSMSRCVLYLFLLFYFLLLAFAHRFLISRHWTSMMRNMSKFAAFVFCSVSVVHNEAKKGKVNKPRPKERA